jgi:hypothetical protein
VAPTLLEHEAFDTLRSDYAVKIVVYVEAGAYTRSHFSST